jgi:hypothetical protein
MISKKLKLTIVSAIVAVAFTGLCSFVTDSEGESTYCKNDPNRNTGICGKDASTGEIKCVDVTVIVVKDCYGTGN